jgi:hypothetical protein
MANYKIIGGDLKQYGPVTDEEVRKWVAEGRLNSQSLVQVFGDIEWKKLSEFPEFAEALAGKPETLGAPLPLVSPDASGREAALQQVKGPAIALKVTAIIGLALVALGFVINIATLMGYQIIPQQPMTDPQMQKVFSGLGGGLGIVQGVVGAVIGVIVLIGAGKMRKLESYQFSMTAAVVAMIPCISPCCFLGLPFGIWALTVLNKVEVKSHFN